MRLSLHGLHRNHVLYSGTLLLQCDEVVGEEKEKGKGKEGTTPDGGVLCYVLRTGFSSAQGELMKMIEFSTQKVYFFVSLFPSFLFFFLFVIFLNVSQQ